MKNRNVSNAVLALTAMLAAAHNSAAQEAAPDSAGDAAKSNTVVVKGIRRSLMTSLDTKREGSGIVDAISAEDIGKFPDQNLAESLQRITGVSIDRAGGEGKQITVRGFGPDFNTVLVNGRQIASENENRAFNFDTVSSDLVNSINVFKTGTATMQSGGIGSTINITTARPLALGGFKVAGTVKALHDDNRGETTPEYSLLVSDTFADGKFGALLAVSRKKAKTRLNQAQTDGWLTNAGIPTAELNGGAGFAGAVFSPRNYDTKVTFEERTRTNANLVLQYRPSSALTLTADALYSDFDIKTDATSYGHWFTAPNVQRARTDGNGTITDLYQELGLATDFHAKKFDRLTSTKSYGLNADWKITNKFNLAFDAWKSDAKRDPNNGGGDQLSLIGYKNRARFQSDSATLPWVSEFEAPATGLVYERDAQGRPITHSVSNYLDPANSRAHVMLRRGWAVDDAVRQYKVDGVWKGGGGDGLVSAKFGLQRATESKALTRWDNEGVGIHCTYCGYPDSPAIPAGTMTVFDAGSDFLSRVSGSGRTPTVWLRHDGEKQFDWVEQQSGKNFDAVIRDNSYAVSEKTTSAYVEMAFAGTLADMPLRMNAGARMEHTDITVSGTQGNIERLNVLDATELSAVYGAKSAINVQNSYYSVLPNFGATLEITDTLVARAAIYRSLTRPRLDDLSPATNIVTTRPGTLTASSGDPTLKPFESNNLDLSLEWYYKPASYISGGFFWKDVSNFIVSSNTTRTFNTSTGVLTDPSTGTDPLKPDAADGQAVFTLTRPSNGPSAVVHGFELAVQHTFDNGLGFIVNGTVVRSNKNLNPGDINQKFAVTGISDSANVVGFYEKGPYQLRVAYNWRDKFLQSLTQLNGDGVTQVAPYGQWDMSGSYEVTKNLSVVFEATNLNRAVVKKYGRYTNQFLLAEDAGRRFALGVIAKF
ncbi:TonB-dependent receptor [Pseudoduganella flava]|uniref:TonB-dependent receptor n=1 Tax=Pseudoduganella flava TaxID=871742 RepID=A0A562PKA0_9BURK|nr:TonB-dependent receptor [Pseudoduganella flava]QGZ42314.1 TonB-dependent receptor [Pseudoduganella flava]TWI44864.1 TonB-dependent receptor [Pseudoduganella flava]